MSENEANQVVLALSQNGVKPCAVGLDIAPEMNFQEWCDFGRKLMRAGNLFQWSIGDWAAFGDSKFGKLGEFAEAHNINEQYLFDLAYTSTKVDKSRRREHLSHTHHREVAALETKDQQQWLAIAETERLSVPELRRRIRQSSGRENALESDGVMFRMVGTKFDEVKGFLLNQPQDWWDDEKRKIWKERLKPVVEFYQNL